MAEHGGESGSDAKVSEIYGNAWKLYEYVDSSEEPTASDVIQAKVKSAIELLEKAVEMVNGVGLFSTNEQIEEVATNELRYLLVPALLAYFTVKNTKKDRLETLKNAQLFYIDYVKLVKLYGVTNVSIPKIKTDEKGGDQNVTSRSEQPNYIEMANKRQGKIQRFKEQKLLEQRLKDLHKLVEKENVDDEIKRDYYYNLLKKWVHVSLEELDGIEMELPMLEHMSKMKSKKSSGADALPPEKPVEKSKGSFRPFILTKDKLQAQVFGLGYPGIPTYTVDQWYDQQVAKGDLPPPDSITQSLQQGADSIETEAKQKEKDDIEKEEKIENDDPETLQKARNWDDWKDDHRRGWGNRQNMG